MDTYVKTCPGCPEVEILADYGDRVGFPWRNYGNPRGALGAILCLVGTERVDIWEACSELALIETNWMWQSF